VKHVAIWHEQMGMTPAEIVAAYPTITLAQVHAALAYYYDHHDDIQAEIEEERRFAEEMKAKAGPSRLEEILRHGRPMARTIRFHLEPEEMVNRVEFI
jgi:hypothetical protein